LLQLLHPIAQLISVHSGRNFKLQFTRLLLVEWVDNGTNAVQRLLGQLQLFSEFSDFPTFPVCHVTIFGAP
jgi:hypothetical protein